MGKKDSGKTTAAPADETEKAAKNLTPEVLLARAQKPAPAAKAPAKKTAAQKPASAKKTAPKKSGSAHSGAAAPVAQSKVAVPAVEDMPQIDDSVTICTPEGEFPGIVTAVHDGMRIDAVVGPFGPQARSIGTIPHISRTGAPNYWKHTK